MLPSRQLRVVTLLCDVLKGDVLWALTGSTSFVLQGLDVVPRDVDVQTDEVGAYEIERRLSAHVIEHVSLRGADQIRSHLGRLRVDDVVVEIMGAVQKRARDGSWEPPVDVALHRRFLDVGPWRVPVLDLAYEEQAYRRLGRVERADQIQRFLADRV